MGHIVVSRLAYSHPGGDLLFSDVSFRMSPGDHVGLVGANGVGKTTLLRILAGELSRRRGRGVAGRGGRLHGPGRRRRRRRAHRPRAVVVAGAARAAARGRAHVRMPSARLAAGDDAAGMRLGTAIADWSALGGYELEGQWDAACRRIVRAAFDELADRPAVTLSGGERKRLVLDVLFASDADVLLLDEPDNFLDVPAKLALERQIARVEEDRADDLPRPRGADRARCARSSRSRATARGCTAARIRPTHAAREERQRRLGDAVKRWQRRGAAPVPA